MSGQNNGSAPPYATNNRFSTPTAVKRNIGLVQTNKHHPPNFPIGLTDNEGRLNSVGLPQKPTDIFQAVDIWRASNIKFSIHDREIIQLLENSDKKLRADEMPTPTPPTEE